MYFKRSPIVGLILGLILLGVLLVEWRSGVVHFHGVRRVGDWDYYPALVIDGLAGVGITVISVWRMIWPSADDDD